MKKFLELNEDEVSEFINDRTQELVEDKDMAQIIARLYANIEYLHGADVEIFDFIKKDINDLQEDIENLTNTVMELYEFKKQQTINY